MPEAQTRRPSATGRVSGNLGHVVYPQYYGLGHYSITIDPGRNDGKEFHLAVDENYGPQITDHRDHSLRFDREQAIELRDALTAAIDWEPDDE